MLSRFGNFSCNWFFGTFDIFSLLAAKQFGLQGRMMLVEEIQKALKALPARKFGGDFILKHPVF